MSKVNFSSLPKEDAEAEVLGIPGEDEYSSPKETSPLYRNITSKVAAEQLQKICVCKKNDEVNISRG